MKWQPGQLSLSESLERERNSKHGTVQQEQNLPINTSKAQYLHDTLFV